MQLFLEAFIPLFVTIDPFGLIPVFLTVTTSMPHPDRRRLIFQAVFAAVLICFGFMFLGQSLFGFLHIDLDDFRIAGGIILLVLAVMDLVIPGKVAVHEEQIVGIVPLAMPLIAGPATLTTTLVLLYSHGAAITSLALVANFAILLVAMLAAERFCKVVGINAIRAFSKVVMVLLAAIAVNFIRVGITNIMHSR